MDTTFTPITLQHIEEMNRAFDYIEEAAGLSNNGPYPVYSIYKNKRGSVSCECLFRSCWIYDIVDYVSGPEGFTGIYHH